jgi:uncharacterized protein involved in response to NO
MIPAMDRPAFGLFLAGSLLLTLTLGAATGLVNLIRIGAGADVPISHRQMHGHTQILGFAALFLMGIAYHALPRILGVGGRPPKSMKAVFWLMFGGVILRNLAQPVVFWAAGRLACLLSAAAESVAAGLFAAFVFSAIRRAPEGKYGRRDPMLRFVFAGNVYFLAAMAINALQGVWLAGHFDPALPAALTEPFYFAAIYGFFLAWIYGFGNRVVSVFLGVGSALRGTPGAARALQAAGIAVFLAAFLPGADAWASALRDAGMVLVALSAVVYLAGAGFLWRRATLPMLPVPGSPTAAIRMAFGALGLWSLLELGGVAVARWTAFPAQNPWWSDAARHVFTIGFLTLLLVGMSYRILPVFSGRRLWSPAMAKWTYALIAAGVAMRLLEYPAAFHPVLYQVGSFMGIPVVAAIVLFTVNLAATLRRPAGAN